MNLDTPASRPAHSSGRHRLDIDGLRALAILLVVTYHVWFGRVSGGVDVFLMISAFFLTSSLVRQAQRGEPINLPRYWLRRFSRLLPAASITVAGVLALTYLALPENTWPQLWRQAWASLFYVQNWELAGAEVDYYARDLNTTSPLQHFWSLSVQGQIFIIWPLLIALTALLLRRHRRRIIPALIAVFGVIFVVSLVYSIIETSHSQAFAYFDTRARMWEFAAGSLMALVLPSITLPSAFRAVLGWIGVIGIIACGIVLDVQGGFPGYLALWPVVCTAFVIVSGSDDAARGGPARWLASAPLRAIGRHAYALYLVHWPVLVGWMVIRDTTEIGPLAGAIIIAVSLALARLLSRDIEEPVQRFATTAADRTWRPALVIAVAIALVAAPLANWQRQVNQQAEQLVAQPEYHYTGAAQIATVETIPYQDAPLIPLPTQLDAEWTEVGTACTGYWSSDSDLLEPFCLSTDESGDGIGETILVIGDSHAQQLSAPLVEAAATQGWDITFLLRGGCPLGFGEEYAAGGSTSTELADAQECESWRREALDFAVTKQPAAVYTVTTKASSQTSERLMAGMSDVVDELLQADITVIGVRDNPRFTFDMYECALTGAWSCAIPREHVLAPINPSLELDDRVVQVDFTPWLCPGDVCYASIGNIAVYIDFNHVSRSYGSTLEPMLLEMLQQPVPQAS